jgi:ABC-type Fe3+/spermidine/putrescine transport system ATPase subunit
LPDVKLVNVTKRYGEITAVDHVNLEIGDGEYVGIIGPSGCGKTTLLRCLAGIVEADEGEIYFGERSVKGLPPEDRGIGYVFQDILLFPHMDSWDNLTFSPRVRGWSDGKIRVVATEILDIMGLSVRSDSYPQELSMGMQQKVALARALASGVDLLLLDEPLSTLDIRVRTQLRFELRRMVKELKLTAIHVTHDQEEAMSISDKLVVMRRGRIEQTGTPLELYSNPSTIFVAKFVGGECNFMEGFVTDVEANHAVIETRGGLTLKSVDTSNPRGRRLVAAVKPEHIRLVVDGGGRRTPSKVVSKWYLGDVTRLELESADEVLIAKVPREQSRDVKTGDVTGFYINPEDVLIFDYPREGLEGAAGIE